MARATAGRAPLALAPLWLLGAGRAAGAPAAGGPDAVALLQLGRSTAGPPANGGQEAISEGELAAAGDLLQASWCAEPRAELTSYSMAWHDVLPPAAAALRSALRHGSEGRSTAEQGDIYAFGVAQGDSLAVLHHAFPEHSLLGFDSFQGLPPEDHEASRILPWREGRFATQKTVQRIVNSAGGPSVTRVYPGFFNESLTSELVAAERMRPASYVDVDCDLHVSSLQALDWLFASRIARVGTVVGYDDWWSIPCFIRRRYHGRRKVPDPLSVGEGLAHAQIAEKYGVVFRCLAGPCKPPPSVKQCHRYNNWGPIFVVAAIGAPRGDHGFEFTSAEVQEWMSEVEACQH